MGCYLRSFEATNLIYAALDAVGFATNDDAALPRRLQETSATHQERRGRFAGKTRQQKCLSLPLPLSDSTQSKHSCKLRTIQDL
jgi:hypothetical protein